MGKRIFTKRMEGLPGTVANGEGGGSSEYLCFSDWVVDEDIEIIGYWLSQHFAKMLDSDGSCRTYCELSLNPIFFQDGVIGRLVITTERNTSPAFGRGAFENITETFPSGSGIPVKEGNHVYLHVKVDATHIISGTVYTSPVGIIYYHKTGIR